MTVHAKTLPFETDSHRNARSEAISALYWYGLIAAYLAATLALIERFRYSLYPDATSYLSIAKAYARGEFSEGVNGYWAPLYCWLLAPLLGAGIDPLLAPKLLSLPIGVLTLAGLSRLCHRLEIPVALSKAVLVAVLPWLVYWSVSYVTPDFLLVCILTWYFSVALDRSTSPTPATGLKAGALGGLAYLAKQYALPFVAVHLLLTGWLRRSEQGTDRGLAPVLTWLAAGYLALTAVGAPWAIAMSVKYGRPMVSGAGSYNWHLYGPGAGGQYNVGTQGLAAPPFDGAVSAWVDPTLYIDRSSWSGSSWHLIGYKLKTVVTTAWLSIVVLEKLTLLAVPILVLGLLVGVGFCSRRRDVRSGYLAVTTLLFFSGYILIASVVLERLVWIGVILLLVLAARILDRAGLWRQPAPVIVLTLTALIGSFWLLPIRRTAQEIDDGRSLYELARRIEGGVRLDGRIATLNRYADSLRVAFFTNADFYGRLSQNGTVGELLGDLRAHEIDYLLIWSTGESPDNGAIALELKRLFPDATRGRIPEVTVLDLDRDTR